MHTAFVDSNGPHFIDAGDLSRELVDELHALCVSLSKGAAEKSKGSITYAFAIRPLGRIQCEYQFRGNAASLILLLDPDAAETVDAVTPKRPPSLRAEARPGTGRKRH